MEQSEKIFWGIVTVAGVFVAANVFFGFGNTVSAQQNQPAAQQVAAQAPAQGMGCMAKGGGCGCGGMMKKQ